VISIIQEQNLTENNPRGWFCEKKCW
jgi:hypothetical protein